MTDSSGRVRPCLRCLAILDLDLVRQEFQVAIEQAGLLQVGYSGVPCSSRRSRARASIMLIACVCEVIAAQDQCGDIVGHRSASSVSRLASRQTAFRVSATSLSRILMFTSLSELSTPAELSIKSVLIRPPFRLYSTRARCVSPRLPPSPTTLQRSSFALTRTKSLLRSPTSV